MKTLNFRTDLHTPSAVANVTDLLNDIEPIDGWHVDLESPDRLLTVQTTDSRIGPQVVQALERAGIWAEQVDEA